MIPLHVLTDLFNCIPLDSELSLHSPVCDIIRQSLPDATIIIQVMLLRLPLDTDLNIQPTSINTPVKNCLELPKIVVFLNASA